MHKFLGGIISKFDAEAKSHMERQSLNPFSGGFSRSPSPRLSKDQYGKPLAGSKTEERGQKAKCHILREILDLCNSIHDLGTYKKTHKQKNDESDDDDAPDEEEIIITFGEIFQMYQNINDKVVGLLIAAKKRGFIFFEKEILFQRRDDDVLIALLKPIAEIRATINKELKSVYSPAPVTPKDESPAVSDSIMTNGTLPNGVVNGSSKSGSSSPRNKVKTAKPESTVEIKNCEQTNNPTTNGITVSEEKDLKESTLEIKDSITQEKPIEPNHVLPEVDAVASGDNLKEINMNVTPLLPNEIVSCQEIKESMDSLKEIKESMDSPKEIKEDTIQPTEEQKLILDEQPIAQLDNTDDKEISSIENIESNANITTELPVSLIPTIEISEVMTPESEQIEEPLLTETVENNKAQDKIEESEVKTADEVENVQCDKNATPTFENAPSTFENAPILPDEPKNEDASLVEDVSVPIDAENKTTDEANLQLDNRNATPSIENALILLEEPKNEDLLLVEDVQPPSNAKTLAVDLPLLEENQDIADDPNCRRRTISNEELMESLTKAVSGRSSSPDPCDEEVEQILLCQSSISILPSQDKIMENELRPEECECCQETPAQTASETIKETLIPILENSMESNKIDDLCSNIVENGQFIESDTFIECTQEPNVTLPGIEIATDPVTDEGKVIKCPQGIETPILSNIETVDSNSPEIIQKTLALESEKSSEKL